MVHRGKFYFFGWRSCDLIRSSADHSKPQRKTRPATTGKTRPLNPDNSLITDMYVKFQPSPTYFSQRGARRSFDYVFAFLWTILVDRVP